jgi:signal transduction histidine kinase
MLHSYDHTEAVLVTKPWYSRLANPLILGGMALALLVLASLQYRWIGELSEAEKARLEKSLERSAQRFRTQFNRRLQGFAAGLTPDVHSLTRENLERSTADRFGARAGAADPALRVRNAWLRRIGPGLQSRLLRLSADGGSWEPVDDNDAGLPVQLMGLMRGMGRRGMGLGPARPSVWTFLADGPYLVQPLARMSRETGRFRPEFLALLYVEPDLEAMRRVLFPELFADAFDHLDDVSFQAAVVEQGQAARLIYASDEELNLDPSAGAAVRLPLLWTWDEAERLRRGRSGMEDEDEDEALALGPFAGGVAVTAGPGPEWILLVRHRAGSLDAVVQRLRRRNLVISGGILAVLITGLGAVLVSARRARRLAETQMEFVAGVSHNLRTPLAVIRSAGDNLAEGVVAAPDQVREYGRLIRSEGRRLTGMVEQTLQFAAVQAGKRQFRIQPTPAADLIRRAVGEARPAAEEEGFEIETDLPAGLPFVAVDPDAASHCLQNLIGNAVKYGGSARWVGVSARETGDAVAVTVRDRGPGIDAEELPRIFEPFFRGRRAVEEQIKGSGLGLALARSDADGFGAKLTVDSVEGEGAAFTLRLPLAKDSQSI